MASMQKQLPHNWLMMDGLMSSTSTMAILATDFSANQNEQAAES
jgi:hypothetical protein